MLRKATLIVLLTALQGCPTPKPATDISELLKMPPEPRAVVVSPVLQETDPLGDRPAKKQYSLSQLLEGAQRIREENGFMINLEKLETLVDLHWTQAEPLLRQYSNGGQPRVAAFSLAKLYLHELDGGDRVQAERYRIQLKAIVENKQAPGVARDFAADALMTTEWKDRDLWYLTLFADGSLRDVSDGSVGVNPLTTPVVQEPDRWIPLITKLVSNPDRAVHDMAVTCLVTFNLKYARRDALMPLLPWLHDPNWSSARDRLRLIQSLADLNIRESIPGLIAVLDQDETFERAYAAEALAHFKDPRAVPALKRALNSETDSSFHRYLILKGLQASGGITADEAAAGLEALAIELSTPEGEQRIEEHQSLSSSKPVDVSISIGLFLKDGAVPSSDAVVRSLDRKRQLERVQPAAARRLEAILDQWSHPLIDRDFLNRLEHGSATASAISSAIHKRTSLTQTLSMELPRLAAGSGIAAGVASSLLSDVGSAARLLHGTDVEAQIALLACSRLARNSLSLDGVATLLNSNDPRLREASERYLEAEDSVRARQFVLSRHAGEARILGERPAGDPGHTSFESLDVLEKELRDRVLARNGPDEVLALLSAGYWGNIGQVIVLVRGATIELFVDSRDSNRRRRELTTKELADLRQFIESNKIDGLGPFDGSFADGIQLEFVRLTKNGGRRVFMNNPQFARNSIYWQLSNTFLELARAPGLREE